MLVNTHSYYSLRYGAVSPKDWVSLFKTQPWSHMALTDINNTSACMTALYLLKDEVGKQPVIGVDFRNGTQQKYVVLARNWKVLSRSMTTFLGIYRVKLNSLKEHQESI